MVGYIDRMSDSPSSPIVGPPPIPPARKPPLTQEQIVVLSVAAALLLSSFLSEFSSRPADELLPDRFVIAVIGTALRVFLTPGGIISIVVLSALFYRFRKPPDSGTIDDGYELLERAIRLEKKGQIEDAIKAYEYVAVRYSHTTAGQDARKSIESLRALRL